MLKFIFFTQTTGCYYRIKALKCHQICFNNFNSIALKFVKILAIFNYSKTKLLTITKSNDKNNTH